MWETEGEADMVVRFFSAIVILNQKSALKLSRGSEVSVCVCVKEKHFKAAEKTNTHTFTEERGEYKQEEECCSSGLIITYFTDEG